jgi:hypothetical protein
MGGQEYQLFASFINDIVYFEKVKWFGTEGGYNVMVMDLLGSSLEDLMSNKNKLHFSLKTTIMVADQMICRLEYLHSKDYVCLMNYVCIFKIV